MTNELIEIDVIIVYRFYLQLFVVKISYNKMQSNAKAL